MSTSLSVCLPYCNAENYYVAGWNCANNTYNGNIYCCGTQTTRYCCNNVSLAVGNTYPPADYCSTTAVWPWTAVLLGVFVTFMFVPAIIKCHCCTSCCDKCSRCRKSCSCCACCTARQGQLSECTNVHSSDNDASLTPDSSTSSTELSRVRSLSVFDPRSPNAFTPPSYDAPYKNPPCYDDISVSGYTNPSYTHDHVTGNDVILFDEAPPVYTSPTVTSCEAEDTVPPEYTEIEIS